MGLICKYMIEKCDKMRVFAVTEKEKMSDLISRQAAIEYLMTNMNWYDEDGYESDEDYKRVCITELINGVPSAESEIIRCKDCKWKQGAECVRFADVRPFADDFCSRAERR